MENNTEVHLYVIMWPNYALVASNLAPDEFGKHYTLGSSRYFALCSIPNVLNKAGTTNREISSGQVWPQSDQREA